jgi:hypothetical protein
MHAAAVARHETDSGTIAGTAGALQRHHPTGALDRSQDPDLGASVGQPMMRQGESRGSKQSEDKPKQCPELVHASPERDDFSLEFRCVQICDVQADSDLRCVAEPPARRRERDAKIRRERCVPGALDEISKPVIVAPLMASRHRH